MLPVPRIGILCAGALLLSGLSGPTDAAPILRIDSASPAPNYSLTTDDQDLAQLTDGELLDFPPWTKRASVGWAQSTPIVLRGRVIGAPGAGFRALQLRVTSAKQVSADVLPPRRIDVYCSADGLAWVHAGALAANPDSFADGTRVTISGILSGRCAREITLIVHASGPFLMLDEIELRVASESAGRQLDSEAANLRTDGLAADSLRRLRTGIQADGSRRLAAAMDGRKAAGPTAWLAPPWGPLSVESMTLNQQQPKALQLSLPEGWSAQYVIGLLNSGDADGVFSLSFGGDDPAAIYRVMPVLAANGQAVYDALERLADKRVTVSPRSLEYLLVRSAPTMESGANRVLVRTADGWSQELLIGITSLGGLSAGDVPPDVVTWSYLSDSPIWNRGNRARLIALQREAGVNVFVVHPRSIPIPGLNGDWERKEPLLRDELRAYKGAGTVLLYVSWKDYVEPDRLRSSGFRRAIDPWVKQLVPLMISEGYGYGDWAVYPVDEPAGEGLALVGRLARSIKAADSNVRVYANPGAVGLTDLLPGGAVSSGLGAIDLWQPLLGVAADSLAPIFRRSGVERWSIYAVGTAPAKTILPNCYRKIAWEAQRLGATGFGFWSFSDTGGSSAWDDLDGTRPDWAAVYEAEAGVVTSRRWEAFRQGVMEYRLLDRCRRGTSTAGQVASCAELRKVIDSELGALQCR
ncbi:MAG: hypothetical protein JNK40_04745 [Chromatiales bacterium]|nr:hypothetical protein [Chromatiales bacterium]